MLLMTTTTFSMQSQALKKHGRLNAGPFKCFLSSLQWLKSTHTLSSATLSTILVTPRLSLNYLTFVKNWPGSSLTTQTNLFTKRGRWWRALPVSKMLISLLQLHTMQNISMTKGGFGVLNKSTSSTGASGPDAKIKPATIAHVPLLFGSAVIAM